MEAQDQEQLKAEEEIKTQTSDTETQKSYNNRIKQGPWHIVFWFESNVRTDKVVTFLKDLCEYNFLMLQCCQKCQKSSFYTLYCYEPLTQYNVNHRRPKNLKVNTDATVQVDDLHLITREWGQPLSNKTLYQRPTLEKVDTLWERGGKETEQIPQIKVGENDISWMWSLFPFLWCFTS